MQPIHNDFCPIQQLISRLRNRYTSAFCVCLIIFAGLAAARTLVAQSSFHPVSSTAARTPADLNKGPSELNHHIAGWALLAVSLLVLASLLFPRPRIYRYIWPGLFMLAGLFLAFWSDGEIWPRGNLSWLWLLHHDAEARQHKIYSMLMVAIGALEYVRMRGLLPRFWRTWAFPVLAVIGAGMLLIHDHTGGSGADAPEALAYRVNPIMAVDGSSPNLSSVTAYVMTQGDKVPLMRQPSSTDPDESAMDSHSMPMDHSRMAMDASSNNSGTSHHHQMNASMLRVEREHFWFMIVGLGIALFKLISDGKFFRYRIIPYLWPACMAVLGFLLVFYQE